MNWSFTVFASLKLIIKFTKFNIIIKKNYNDKYHQDNHKNIWDLLTTVLDSYRDHATLLQKIFLIAL